MTGAPPRPEDQVTLANWRQAPFNRWAFRHLREVVPTAAVPHDPNTIWPLARQETDLGELSFESDSAAMTLEAMLAASDTDGFLILQHGRILYESYRRGMTANCPHILFSVTKSVTGILAGVLAARGEFDPEAPIAEILPEMAESAYGDATVRHLLDMTAGVAFEEDYLATSGPFIAYRQATGWNPSPAGATATGLRAFLATMADKAKPHGGVFRYLSPNSDLLGWILERASGQRFATLLSEALWQPLGAVAEASIAVDPLGAARSAGGLCVTLRDFARFGQLLIQDGARDGHQIVPAAWIADIRSQGDLGAWEAGEMAAGFPGLPIRYRSQWYVLGDRNPPYFGIGIHGQWLYLDPARELVVAKLSSQPEPVDEAKDSMTLAACQAIGAALAG